jgi:transcription-repair coupling factor (superfamily II helicase)
VTTTAKAGASASGTRRPGGPELLTGVPEGYDGLVLGQLAAEASARLGSPQAILHVARDDRRLGELEAALAFFAPTTKVIALPAWDTVPYDRIGPNPEISARRITALALLAAGSRKEPTVVLTTVNAVLQRLPPRDFIKRALKQIAPGQRIDRIGCRGVRRREGRVALGQFGIELDDCCATGPGALQPCPQRLGGRHVTSPDNEVW